MPSKDRWQQRHTAMLGEGKDRARPIGAETRPGDRSAREGRWVRPVALAVALASTILGSWLIWGADVTVGGITVVVLGGGGGVYVAATARPERR